jgi:hypothetical protein
MNYYDYCLDLVKQNNERYAEDFQDEPELDVPRMDKIYKPFYDVTFDYTNLDKLETVFDEF